MEVVSAAAVEHKRVESGHTKIASVGRAERHPAPIATTLSLLVPFPFGEVGTQNTLEGLLLSRATGLSEHTKSSPSKTAVKAHMEF